MLKENFYENPFLCYDYIPIGVCIINENFNIIFWNRTLEAWTNTNREEILYKNLFSIFPHLESPKYKSRIQMMFMGRPPMVFSPMLNHYFIPVKDVDGNFQAQTATLSSIPTNEIGKFNVLISIENVSTLYNKVQQYREIKNQAIEELKKRNEAEEKLKEYTNKLEQLNATKDKFFSIIAHDLINPISSLYKLTKILKENVNIFSKDEIVDLVEEMEKSASHTYKLLENLLTWSRSQLNKFIINIECHNLKNLIELSLNDLTAQISLKKIKLKINYCDEITICCDLNMMTTVLRNILSNAIKYTNYGGEIKIQCEQDEKYAHISVEDNGVGMDEDTLSNVFRIDKTLSKPGTDREIGTGLGLVICKEFVEKMGGKIRAESKLGVGSKFTISIPLSANHK